MRLGSTRRCSRSLLGVGDDLREGCHRILSFDNHIQRFLEVDDRSQRVLFPSHVFGDLRQHTVNCENTFVEIKIRHVKGEP